MSSSPIPRARSRARARRAGGALLSSAGLALACASPAAAVNFVTTANGVEWGVHDAARPGLDTGSIRNTTNNGLVGFGNLRIVVSGVPDSDTTKRFNGEMLRGFGLKFNGGDGSDPTFETTTPVTLGGVEVERTLKILSAKNTARWLDTFTNTTDRVITLQTSFGGTAGTTNATTHSKIVETSSGDTAADSADAWVQVATPHSSATTLTSGPTISGPSAVVLGTPSFSGNFTGIGVQQYNPFTTALPTSAPADPLKDSFYGYKHTLTLQPGQTKSVLRFVVVGRGEKTSPSSTLPDPGTQIAAVKTGATDLAANPDLSGLPFADICTVANWNLASLPSFNEGLCEEFVEPVAPTAKPTKLPVTGSPYDVVGKSMSEIQEDMEAGVTTSQEVTRAYLDRIAAYDTGPFGLHTFITVADSAMEQAKAADAKRAAGETGDLLGIPVAVKDNYDTAGIQTTNGTKALEGFVPKKDAFQVKQLRDAGAVIIGKTTMSEFANSGSYSESGFGMAWNAHKPSKTTLGSSGGTGSAIPSSFAAIGMGSQTGVSLYAPSTGGGLVTMRGTDGIASGAGVMPLTWLQDFAGPMGRTVEDVARFLNVTAGTDPEDVQTVHDDAGEKRPDDYTDFLDEDALVGKKIGYIPGSFTANSSYGQDTGTMDAMVAELQKFVDAGATLVPIDTVATPVPGTGTPDPAIPDANVKRRNEGWARYFGRHDNAPFTRGSQILSSPKNLPYNRQTVADGTDLTDAEVTRILEARDVSKERIDTWMDTLGVDAVVYPGFRSDVYDNDGAQTLSSDRNHGFLTSNYGLPTIVVPVGSNPVGDPMTLQIIGRAYDDGPVLGLGYALEQEVGAEGKIIPATTPKLQYVPGTPVPPITPQQPTEPVTLPSQPDPVSNASAPVPASQTAAKLTVTIPSSARVRGGRVRVALKNPTKRTLTGTIVLRGRATKNGKTGTYTFGTAQVTIGAGKSRTVSIKLGPTGLKALKGKSSTKVTARFFGRPTEDTTTTTKSVTLRP
ncbi:amidase [Svornostia abyssi]|uniref:Amidase n=1 Tax=Svornostia abyssi TaxID=2898438 RepID=A0ABY5PDL7_9ACTN|nr:amidase [Parviterribacteraceae bacterium J379]